MRTRRVRIEIQSEEEEKREILQTIRRVQRGESLPKAEFTLVFRSVEDLRRYITPERVRMLQTIRKERPGSVYELASLLGRDRKSVTDDLRDLEFVGLVHIGKRQVGRRKTTVPSVSYSRIEIGVPV